MPPPMPEMPEYEEELGGEENLDSGRHSRSQLSKLPGLGDSRTPARRQFPQARLRLCDVPDRDATRRQSREILRGHVAGRCDRPTWPGARLPVVRGRRRTKLDTGRRACGGSTRNGRCGMGDIPGPPSGPGRSQPPSTWSSCLIISPEYLQFLVPEYCFFVQLGLSSPSEPHPSFRLRIPSVLHFVPGRPVTIDRNSL